MVVVNSRLRRCLVVAVPSVVQLQIRLRGVVLETPVNEVGKGPTPAALHDHHGLGAHKTVREVGPPRRHKGAEAGRAPEHDAGGAVAGLAARKG